jgi:hypothetical protein
MEIRLVTLELTTADLAEGNTRTMVGVDIRGNLKDEARELLFLGLYLPFLRLGGTRTGGYLHETVEKFLNTKIIEG